MKLSPKQEKFCLEYLKDLNATQAAIRAGYSEKTARQIGTENLSKPYIAEKIAELKKGYVEEAEFEIKDWVKEHLKIIQSNPTQALESTGVGFVFKDIDELPDELKSVIKKISFKKGQGMEIELYNKQTSLDALGKWMGSYEKDNTQQQKDFTFNINVRRPEAEEE